MAKTVVLVLVFGVLSLPVNICYDNNHNSNTKAVTAVTRLTPQVWEHFTKLSAHSFTDASKLDKDTYGYFMLLLSYNKITGASTDDIIFALEQFAIKHPDMKAHANSAIDNVQGMIPGGELLVYVRHNGELNGVKLKVICLLANTYISGLTGKPVHDYVLTTYSYDNSRAVEPLDGPNRMNLVTGLTVVGGTITSLIFVGPLGWVAVPISYLSAGYWSQIANLVIWNEETAQLNTYTSSADFGYFLEAAFAYHLVEQNTAIVDHSTRTLTLL